MKIHSLENTGSISVDGVDIISLNPNGTIQIGTQTVYTAASYEEVAATGGTITNQTIGNQIINGNLIVTGSLTAQQFIVSSSVTYLTTSFASGSTKFGDTLDDVHGFTGSVKITGSLNVIGGITGSIAATNGIVSGSSQIFTGYDYEIHVSQVDGNDTTGNGDLLTPVASITKALQIVAANVGVTDRRTIIIHPGTYTENPTVSTTNTYIFALGLLGANTAIVGTLTINAACRVSGIKMTNLVVNTTAAVYINNTTVDTQMTVTNTGYLETTGCSFQCPSGVTVSGAAPGVVFNSTTLWGLVVNNASAIVVVRNSPQVLVATVIAGNLALSNTLLFSSTPTGNAITTIAGSVVTLSNLNILDNTGLAVARVSLSGFYSIIDVVYDKPNSTLVALSGTGGSLNSIDYFQHINADKFITQGGTSNQFVKGDGSLQSIIAATTGSNTFVGNQTITGSLTVTGNLTAQQFIVSSSVTYLTTSFASGSTKFGDTLDDVHGFTGSLSISGSFIINGASYNTTTSGTSGTGGTSGTNGTAGTGGTSGADGSSGATGSSGSGGTSGTSGGSGSSGATGSSGSAGTSGTSGTATTSTRVEENFIATANQTTFTVTGGYTVGLVDVFVNGVRFLPTEYTATNGTTIVFGAGLMVNDEVTVLNYTSVITALPTSRNVQDFTATAAQTTFTVTNGYIVGLIDVFVNGSKLTSSEFTATNGTTFVLTIASTVGDQVQSINYTASVNGISGAGTANYVPKFTASGTIGNSLIFDNGTNAIGIGVVPQTWFSTTKVIQFSAGGALWGIGASNNIFSSNEYLNAAGNSTYIATDFATRYTQASGIHIWNTAASGTAGTAIAYTESMRITTTGSVGIGTSSPSTKLHVYEALTNSTAYLTVQNNRARNAAVNLKTTVGDYFVGVGIGADINQFQIYDNIAGVNRLTIASNGDITTTANVKATNFNVTAESGFRGGLFPYKLVSGAGVDMGMTLFAEGGTNNGNIYFCVNGSVTKVMTIATTGAVTIAGSLSKGSGSFRIDHPIKSETHQLVHSFIEGPQADLIYRGKLTLVNGKAQANIDEVSTMTEGTFEALCREVQCFTTNENGWDLVKGKVIGNIIYIESQNTNSIDEISWMVIGERKDKHMMDTEWTDEQGKVIVEPLKAK